MLTEVTPVGFPFRNTRMLRVANAETLCGCKIVHQVRLPLQKFLWRSLGWIFDEMVQCLMTRKPLSYRGRPIGGRRRRSKGDKFWNEWKIREMQGDHWHTDGRERLHRYSLREFSLKCYNMTLL